MRIHNSLYNEAEITLYTSTSGTGYLKKCVNGMIARYTCVYTNRHTNKQTNIQINKNRAFLTLLACCLTLHMIAYLL